MEGPRSFYQPNDMTGQKNRIIKPQVRRPSEGVALILFGPLMPRSCLTTHSAKGISGLTAQFELPAMWAFSRVTHKSQLPSRTPHLHCSAATWGQVAPVLGDPGAWHPQPSHHTHTSHRKHRLQPGHCPHEQKALEGPQETHSSKGGPSGS